jgi:hypothetical protein
MRAGDPASTFSLHPPALFFMGLFPARRCVADERSSLRFFASVCSPIQ